MLTVKCVMFLVVVLLSTDTFGYISSKEKEGYPEGFLSDCPGSTKPAYITKKSLRDIGIVVIGGNDTTSYSRRLYSYYQVKEMVYDPDLDFKNKKTMVFITGFMDNSNNYPSNNLAQIYRRLGYNVMLVSMHKFVTLHYPISMRYTRPVGKHLAEMLTNLTEAGLDIKHLELSGVSSGAQVMSYVAKHIRELTGQNVSQLIGLDPAGPCFRNLGPEDRLDMSDADFVLIVQTNIDVYGMAAPVGHVNFFINGGESQPADAQLFTCNAVCSHMKSFFIWKAALLHRNGFVGIKCDSVQQARSHQCYDRLPRETNVLSLSKTNRTNTGIFYVATSNKWPYFLGSKGLRKENQFWAKYILESNKN